MFEGISALQISIFRGMSIVYTFLQRLVERRDPQAGLTRAKLDITKYRRPEPPLSAKLVCNIPRKKYDGNVRKDEHEFFVANILKEYIIIK